MKQLIGFSKNTHFHVGYQKHTKNKFFFFPRCLAAVRLPLSVLFGHLFLVTTRIYTSKAIGEFLWIKCTNEALENNSINDRLKKELQLFR
jgi:hypothetical protein